MSELAQTVRESRVALIVLAGLCAGEFCGLLLLRVRGGEAPRSALARTLVDVAAGASIVGVVLVTFAPTGQYQAREVHLLPISDLYSTATTRGVTDALAQAGGNIALFVPLGILVPLRWRRLDSWGNAVAAAAIFSTTIEIVQFVLGSGHTTSVDDVVMNTFGGVLGLFLLRSIRRGVGRRGAGAGDASDPRISRSTAQRAVTAPQR